ncbi:hypothetical protein L6452_20022 [Arctium lappa]|uniref:Uncharacterized protein n=1 Tax=Arctium lappa TaxID=4217 RepID=A0ACB9BAK7_ARCLA|nr:hypothetical protein L6452_20022 [Arctium lappa]
MKPWFDTLHMDAGLAMSSGGDGKAEHSATEVGLNALATCGASNSLAARILSILFLQGFVLALQFGVN